MTVVLSYFHSARAAFGMRFQCLSSVMIGGADLVIKCEFWRIRRWRCICYRGSSSALMDSKYLVVGGLRLGVVIIHIVFSKK